MWSVIHLTIQVDLEMENGIKYQETKGGDNEVAQQLQVLAASRMTWVQYPGSI